MNRKAQGLELNVIVLIILALIVLIVMIAIFHKQIFKSEKKVESVVDPLEIKSRCFTTWKEANDESYDACIERCTKEMDPEDETCFFAK